jgi:hypothetical protein
LPPSAYTACAELRLPTRSLVSLLANLQKTHPRKLGIPFSYSLRCFRKDYPAKIRGTYERETANQNGGVEKCRTGHPGTPDCDDYCARRNKRPKHSRSQKITAKSVLDIVLVPDTTRIAVMQKLTNPAEGIAYRLVGMDWILRFLHGDRQTNGKFLGNSGADRVLQFNAKK